VPSRTACWQQGSPAGSCGHLLPKRFETVASFFGTTAAGCVFVPVNPLLKPPQVGHILRDCAVRLLITTAQRAAELADELASCPDLQTLVVLDESGQEPVARAGKGRLDWKTFTAAAPARPHRLIDTDIAAILYTSGSTGRPKGVVLSHKNVMTVPRAWLSTSRTDRTTAACSPAIQLRLWLQPAIDSVPRWRERGVDGLPLPS